jgi:hypothetical protein
MSDAYRYPPTALLREPGSGGERAICDRPIINWFPYAPFAPYCNWANARWYDWFCGGESFTKGYCAPGGLQSLAPAGTELRHDGLLNSGDWVDVQFERSERLATDFLQRQVWFGNPAIEVRSHAMVVHSELWRWGFDLPPTPTGATVQHPSSRPAAQCYTMAYLFGFFNGVWNTRTEAEDSLEAMELQSFLGPKWREAPVRYELFYNQTCKVSDNDTCLQDVAEVFRQRSAELDGLLARRWEYFWEQVTGQGEQPGSFTQRLLGRVVRTDNALASWFGGLYNATLAKITALGTLMAENPPTAQDTAEHTAQLIAAGQRAERAVLVAHSQGNLFVNAAYDAYLAHGRQVGASRGNDTGYVAAQVVHIAPASPTLRGPYVLADIDRVITALPWVDGTLLARPNLVLAPDAKDSSGHKLLNTYLDESRPARAQIRQLITDALDKL